MWIKNWLLLIMWWDGIKLFLVMNGEIKILGNFFIIKDIVFWKC